MHRTLIACSTVDGHTLRICSRIGKRLELLGHDVALLEIGKPSDLDVMTFDQVVIGASIRYGTYRPAVFEFIEAYRQVLEGRRSAFFSVNVVARKAGKDSVESNPYLKLFRRRTTWRPTACAVFAGKLDYARYGFLDRQMIRLIMWMTRGPTDTSVSVDFTDWAAVDAFAQQLAGAQAPAQPAGGGRS
jgi:menaquinone-dependent protoporphyrinogen oxidase